MAKQITCVDCGNTAYDYDEQWYSTIIGPVCRECVGIHMPFNPREEEDMGRSRREMVREQNAIDDFEYSKL